ncbi:UDP-N-acetylmuramate--L-alanine ligase [Streptomyces sp. NPDC091292]|uniref:UDP-N-acetylmuramate--L-alanine ligase n=1 Tax=Streptomyces sp. NPDC091292 TaxID=3365991 RepID=UPI00382DCC99
MTETRHIQLPAPVRDIDWRRPFFLGIGGAGMAPLAALCRECGAVVAGYDSGDCDAVWALQDLGVDVAIGDVEEALCAVQEATVVVWSTAIPDDHPLLAVAREAGVPLAHRSDLLAVLMEDKVAVAVAGTHGKTTTSAMLSRVLWEAGGDPSHVIGGDVGVPLSGARAGSGVFVAEADESDGSFTRYSPRVGVVLNVDNDHPEAYPELADAVEAFTRFALSIAEGGTLVCSADDDGARSVASAVATRRAGLRVVTVGEAEDADWRILGIDLSRDGMSSRVCVRTPEQVTYAFEVNMPGRHNGHNAAVALAAGAVLGFDTEHLAPGLEEFDGVDGRLGPLGDVLGVRSLSSYAHHPTAVTADITAAREVAGPDGRVVLVFQPSGYARVALMEVEFARALAGADQVLLLEIRDLVLPEPLFGVCSEQLAGAVRSRYGHVACPVGGVERTAGRVAAVLRPGDVLLAMGPGGEPAEVVRQAMNIALGSRLRSV